jgi:hypothetical protein
MDIKENSFNNQVKHGGLAMKKFWFILALFILGCSKAQLPVAPQQHATLLVTAIQANGESLDPAQVYLDGQLVGTTPYKNEEVQIGLHALRLTKEGFKLFTEQIFIEREQFYSVEAILEPISPNKELTLEFTVIPDSALFGEPVPIQWQSDGYQVIIDQGVGVRGPVGSEEVNFANPGKKVFTATAYGEDNLVTIRQDSVFIKEAPQPILPVILLSATRVVSVDSVATISWYSQNADYVVVDYVDNAELQGRVEVAFSSPGIRIVTATAFNQAGYTSTTDTIEVIEPTVNSVDDIIVPAQASVRADQGESGYVNRQAATINIETPGKYQIFAEVWYNSGDAQLNESYYLLTLDEFGREYAPQNPNAGIYKVVPDEPGEPHTASKESGIFSLSSGTHVIEVIHYAKISDIYPQFLYGPIDGPESVKILGFRLVYLSK